MSDEIIEELREIFNTRIRFRSAVGVDRVRPEAFELLLHKHLEKIVSDYEKKKIKFRPYRELLIVKSREKPPRLVSIPSVRDKLIMSWILQKINNELGLKAPFVYEVIKRVSGSVASGAKYYLKADISGFYDNIKHDKLIEKLQSRISDPNIMDILVKAITNQTTPINQKPSPLPNLKGVPQGIPLSNALANFYANEIDLKFQSDSTIQYARYVDDILILADNKFNLEAARTELDTTLKSLNLPINIEKTKDGSIEDGFDFLGYSFDKSIKRTKVSVRESSYSRYHLSLLKLFTKYKVMASKNRGQDYLTRFVWDLNLRITGGILDEKRYGWLFFFSQIDLDCPQVFSLDRFVDFQLKRLGLSRKELKIKRHSRALIEIKLNASSTNYVPKFDFYTDVQKKEFLETIASYKKSETDYYTTNDLNYHFKKNIFRHLRSLESDIGKNS